jgi:hypothetical protein
MFAKDVGLIDATSNGRRIAWLKGSPGSDYPSIDENNDLSSGDETPFADAKPAPKPNPKTHPLDVFFDEFIAEFDDLQVTD